MTTIIEILKEKRNLVIAELKEAFHFKAVELSVLMTDYVAYLNEEGYEAKHLETTAAIKHSINEFYNEKGDTYSRDIMAGHNHDAQQAEIAKRHFTSK